MDAVSRERILDASLKELESQGITRYRIKRVADLAGVSVSLLYSYFTDREGLLAETIIVRYHEEVMRAAVRFVAPLAGVTTADELRHAMQHMIDDAERPERYHSRTVRVESFSFANHNDRATEGIQDSQREAGQFIIAHVQPIVDRELLVPSIDAAAFARVWYALFFGRVALQGDHPLAASLDEWRTSLYAIAESMIRS